MKSSVKVVHGKGCNETENSNKQHNNHLIPLVARGESLHGHSLDIFLHHPHQRVHGSGKGVGPVVAGGMFG